MNLTCYGQILFLCVRGVCWWLIPRAWQPKLATNPLAREYNRAMQLLRYCARFLALLVGCATPLALAPPATGHDSASDRPPNIVFFLVDDLGWADLGCYGSTFYETPHLDRLAADGARFTDAYAACPVCSPTRASILTGRYPWRTRVTDYIAPAGKNQPEQWNRNTQLLPAPYSDRLALDETTLAELLGEAGYATFFGGKWHLGPEGHLPEDQGFDVNLGGGERGGPYGGGKYFSPYGNPRLPDGPPGEHLPDRLANEAVAFLREHRQQPMLIYLSFYSVHTPLMARDDLRRKYEEKRQRLQLRPQWGDEGTRKVRLVQEHPVYAGMVEAMDQAVGKVLEGLAELGLANDTIVLFTSDNGGLATSEGYPTSNLPLRAGKGWLYEGGIRVPLIVRWPDVVEGGTVVREPVISIDYLPTLLEVAGVKPPPQLQLDGVSLASLLAERKPPAPRNLFWHYPHYGNQGGAPGGAIRQGPWKLVEWYEGPTSELYRLDSDPAEQHNLADAHPEQVATMRRALREFLEHSGAVMPTANAEYDAQKQSGRWAPPPKDMQSSQQPESPG